MYTNTLFINSEVHEFYSNNITDDNTIKVNKKNTEKVLDIEEPFGCIKTLSVLCCEKML